MAHLSFLYITPLLHRGSGHSNSKYLLYITAIFHSLFLFYSCKFDFAITFYYET